MLSAKFGLDPTQVHSVLLNMTDNNEKLLEAKSGGCDLGGRKGDRDPDRTSAWKQGSRQGGRAPTAVTGGARRSERERPGFGGPVRVGS